METRYFTIKVYNQAPKRRRPWTGRNFLLDVLIMLGCGTAVYLLTCACLSLFGAM